MLSDVNKNFIFKSLLTMPSNVMPLQHMQTFPSIIWIFTEDEGDGIKSSLSFKNLLDFKQQALWAFRLNVHTAAWLQFLVNDGGRSGFSAKNDFCANHCYSTIRHRGLKWPLNFKIHTLAAVFIELVSFLSVKILNTLSAYDYLFL